MAEENNEAHQLNLETMSEDCVFEIFDRLATNYLYTIAKTCTRFFDLAAIQYRRKHPEKYVCVTVIDDKIVLQPDEYDVKYFGRKFLNMIIRGDGRNYRFEDELIQFIQLECSSNLRVVRFEEAMLHGAQLKPIKDMLERVETMVLHKCGMNDDFNDCLLSKCHRLKHLIISDSYTVIDPAGSKWMQQQYPLLESVQICSITLLPFQREQWEQFFRQNPQINSFACDHWFAADKDDRPVKIIRNAPNLTRLYLSLRGIGHLNSTYYDLSILCKCSQFQRLELQFTGQTGIQYLCRHSKKMLATFEQLHAIHFTDVLLTKESAVEIAWLQNIKQLNFVGASFGTEFAEHLSKNLPCLEEIYGSNTANDFTPFVRLAPNLKKIELSDTDIGNLHLGWGLHWLNDERTKVEGACPITIYVRNTAIDGAEQAVISSGIIAIKPIIQDKQLLTKVPNTFVNL